MTIITKKASEVKAGDFLVAGNPGDGERMIAIRVTFIEKGDKTVRFWGGRNDPLLGSEDFWVTEAGNDQDVEVVDLESLRRKP